jgi:sigma54-dependent transcription regulator
MKNRNRDPQLSQGGNHAGQDEVARRAYELYQARGQEPGRELDDWLQAEREISQYREVVHNG